MKSIISAAEHVGVAYDIPEKTANCRDRTIRIMEAIRRRSPGTILPGTARVRVRKGARTCRRWRRPFGPGSPTQWQRFSHWATVELRRDTLHASKRHNFSTRKPAPWAKLRDRKDQAGVAAIKKGKQKDNLPRQLDAKRWV